MRIVRVAVTLCVAVLMSPRVVRGQWYSFSSLLQDFRDVTSLIFSTFGEMLEQDVDQERVVGPFPCDVSLGRSDEPPTDVNRLRPGDFKVVGALGDSLTAGLGIEAKNILGVIVSHRGRSWAGGGEGTWREYLTLPNVLKVFNPSLVGYSSTDVPLTHQLNVAFVGAKSKDLMPQARVLVSRIMRHPAVDVLNDWKIITINIGHNDFCNDLCVADASEILRNHSRDLTSVLDYLEAKLPRTFVSIVLPANMRVLWDQGPSTTYCKIIRSYECPCVFNERYKSRINEMTDVMTKWQKLDHQVAESGRYDNKTDFAVVVQPFTEHSQLPVKRYLWFFNFTDPEFFSSDCFHFSQKTNARAANALWNNLLQPIGRKTTNWDELFRKFYCPTKEHPYVYTKKNSDMANLPNRN